MEPNNLQVASNYINNVLLARGLLRSGQPIDFAQPENEEGGADATMARVINLVNDLVLRRDVCDDCIIYEADSHRCSAKPITENPWPRPFEPSEQTSRNKPSKSYVDPKTELLSKLTLHRKN